MDSQKQKTAISHYEKANLLYQQGNLIESESFYRKAIKINKNFAEAYGNLGNVLKDLGRIKEATGAYRKALNIYPNHPLLLNNLGNMFHLRGDTHKAAQYFRDSIKQNTSNPDAYNNLGNILKELDQLDEAEDCYTKALSINPEFADAHNNLGNLLNSSGKHDKAIASFQQAIKINPNFCDAYNNLGIALMNLSRADDAVASYRTALEFEPENKELHNNLGIALREQGNLDDSIDAYNKALQIDINYTEAHINLGTTLRAQDKLEEAIEQIEQALTIEPGSAEALRALSFIKKFNVYDDQVHTMENLFSQKTTPDHQKLHLGFALGKAFEDIKDYDKAFHYISEGNRFKRKSVEYSSKKTSDHFQKLIDYYSSSFFSTHINTNTECKDKTPIFILGMPRSGTSLVEQILSSHAQVYGAGELKTFSELTNKHSTESFPDCIPGFDGKTLTALGDNYIRSIRKHSDTATYITDKMPHNFMYIGLIKAALPNAKIIHCVRDPMDNCLSIYKNLFGQAHYYAYDLVELGEYYSLYSRLMNHLREIMSDDIYEISYEKLVADQERQSEKLIAHCNLPWDDSCLSFHKNKRTVSTLSAIQVRKSIYKDSVALWKKYEEQLEPLRKAIYK